MANGNFRLDDLYKMTSHIYSEQNAPRPTSATFSHFVEVCGLLTIHARNKKREAVTFEDALCKALGWYFPLLAKFKVASVEELIYRKYPYACPYCRSCPHIDGKCKAVKGTANTVDHRALRKSFADNAARRPSGLNEWQEMFNEIYPRNLDNPSRSIVGLFEELGELAEAVRVFDRFPKYFAGEAADVFSYLMGLANEYNLQLLQDEKDPFDFETEYVKRFPGLCVQCGYPVCVCPLVPDATVGRMAKELEIGDLDKLFVPSFEVFREESMGVAERALDSLGGYAGLAKRFPFDRGEANRTLVLFCLKVAEHIGDIAVAERLRSAAIRISDEATYAGSPRHPDSLEEIIAPVRQILQENKGAVDRMTEMADSSKSDMVGRIVVEVVMGDKYVTSSTVAQGAGAQGVDTNFSLKWEGLRSEVDLNAVARELGIIRAHLALSPSRANSETDRILGEAQVAAKKGNGASVLKTLAKIGAWVTDTSVSLGAEVIVGLLKG